MGPVIDLPDAVRAMAARGPEWATWVDGLPKLVQSQLDDWDLIAGGRPHQRLLLGGAARPHAADGVARRAQDRLPRRRVRARASGAAAMGR